MKRLAQPSERLVLGPLVRYADHETVTVWVETDRAAEVTVTAGAQVGRARTFAAHGHHFALVDVTGLPSGERTPYTVHIDDEQVWPIDEATLPASALPTRDLSRDLRMAFGSCRTSVSHDRHGHLTHGVDALRSYGLRMAGLTTPARAEDDDLDDPGWPDLLLLLGDQVYADETTEAMQEFIESRRDIKQPPWTELQDFQEYAHLYKLAWSDPVIRWTLATLPSAMIFDDHDIRDDWNTSQEWRDDMAQTSWWQGRVVAGLGSYWIYQHLGNLSPAMRAEDALWRRVLEHEGPDELDITDDLDAFADRADKQPTSYRWSYTRDLDDRVRLVVIDSRAARQLEPGRRALLDEEEMAWLDEQMRGDVDHLLLGTSLPFLLAPGLHGVEAFSEALAGGAWGHRLAGPGETIRRTVDLEHWAAFQDSFQRVSRMVAEVAAGQRGRAPRTVTFLSGDVHHSYVSEATRSAAGLAAGLQPPRSRILQAVCSPIRNPLSPRMRYVTALLSYGVAGPFGRLISRSTKVPAPLLTWKYAQGPWFDNNLAHLEVTEGGLRMWWATGQVRDGVHETPWLVKVAAYNTAGEGRRAAAGRDD